MRKFMSILLAVVLVATVAVVAVSAAGSGASTAANTATVTIYDLKGGSVTQTYNVGETFTAYLYLNISGIGNNRVGSLRGEQTYTSSILEFADEYDKQVGTIKNLNTLLPICGSGAVANAAHTGAIYYNASNPSYEAYLFDSDDSALIVSHYTVTAPGEATITNGLTTLAQADYYLTRIVDKGKVINDSFTSSAALSEPTTPVVTGNKVSGKVTSYLDASETVTVELVQGETVIKTFEGTGNTLEYAIEDVEDGSYVLRFSKKNHVTRDYDITVSGDTTVEDAKIHPLGDINGDGKITNIDYTIAKSHASGKKLIEGYQLKCADVVKKDGLITAIEVARIKSAARGRQSLWS